MRYLPEGVAQVSDKWRDSEDVCIPCGTCPQRQISRLERHLGAGDQDGSPKPFSCRPFGLGECLSTTDAVRQMYSWPTFLRSCIAANAQYFVEIRGHGLVDKKKLELVGTIKCDRKLGRRADGQTSQGGSWPPSCKTVNCLWLRSIFLAILPRRNARLLASVPVQAYGSPGGRIVCHGAPAIRFRARISLRTGSIRLA